jgi:hypothetical protein
MRDRERKDFDAFDRRDHRLPPVLQGPDVFRRLPRSLASA